MSRMRLAGLAAVLAVAACGGGGPTQPKAVPGDLVVTLTAPGTDAGALLIRVVGNVSNVSPVGNYGISFKGDSAITHIILTGDVATGDILKVRVPDVEKYTGYSAFVEQVASRTDYALLQTSGYTFTFRK